MVTRAKAEPVFREEALRFLRGLQRHNNRDWFNERKAVYERELKEPMARLVEQVNDAMGAWAPEHVRPAQKAMLRIYRDIRFSKDKRPYKQHMAAWWGRQGMEKTSGAGFYLQVGAGGVHVAAGVYMPDREQLLRLRRFLVERHGDVRTILGAARLKRLGLVAMAGRPLTRPPKGFAGLEPAAEALVRQQDWGVSADLPAEMALAPEFLREVVRRLESCAPLVHLLNEPLVPRGRSAALVAPLPFG